ncbi:membrane-associated protein [Staphylococcus phage vB_SepS_456]|uniref:Membrane-associated protein n=1 Tax=Staphylococcus phage vB_SepS_456 TaxID=2797318 RepID=A0A7U0GDU4_9CAUD|nr:hypothetical protein Phi456_00051 [Staphylococcus phage 456]QQV93347.1 membrane-associated protein [Staphylococcus phage vB_SepS_456]
MGEIIIMITNITLSMVFILMAIFLIYLFVEGIKDKEYVTIGFSVTMFLLSILLFLHFLYFGILGGY